MDRQNRYDGRESTHRLRDGGDEHATCNQVAVERRLGRGRLVGCDKDEQSAQELGLGKGQDVLQELEHGGGDERSTVRAEEGTRETRFAALDELGRRLPTLPVALELGAQRLGRIVRWEGPEVLLGQIFRLALLHPVHLSVLNRRRGEHTWVSTRRR